MEKLFAMQRRGWGRITRPIIIILFSLISFTIPSNQASAQSVGDTLVSVSGGISTTWKNETGSSIVVEVIATGGGGGDVLELVGIELLPVFEGGTGATVTGEFTIANNEEIRITAGRAGTSDLLSGGGGGSSGAINCGTDGNCINGTVMLVAGAGGGAGIGAIIGEDGEGGLGTVEACTEVGAGGTGTSGAGGGGKTTSGAQGIAGINISNGGTALNMNGIASGGNGVISFDCGDGGHGLSGGGGGGLTGGGGGGGHVGGNGGASILCSGDGGTSCNIGDNPSESPGTTGGGSADGHVTVVMRSVLPVELIDFSATLRGGNGVQLNWRTASETDNAGFSVQRSSDLNTWVEIDFISGRGTSFVENKYGCLDQNPFHGTNYYRLKQIDFDGKETTSPVAIVSIKNMNGDISIYPNPSPDGQLSLKLKGNENGNALLEVFDATGKRLHKKQFEIYDEGEIIFPVDLRNLPSGLYTAVTTLGT